ncbi:MAG: choice-of-anchor B family protein [Gemmatimonadota bacterium]
MTSRLLSRFACCGVTLFALAFTAIPVAAQSGSFGNSVVVDGDALIVGEPNNSFRPGTVYVYRKVDGEWMEASRLISPDAERSDGFGAVLALNGNTLFVASRGGRIDAFERSGLTWAHSSTLNTEDVVTLDPRCNYNGYCGIDFGLSLASAGDWLFVGQSGVQTELSRLQLRRRSGGEGVDSEPSGMVYAYRLGADGRWTEQQRLEAPTPAAGDAFGAAVAMAGNRALVGAPLAGHGGGPDEATGRVFEYVLRDGGWRAGNEIQADVDAQASFGAAITMSEDHALVGAPFARLGYGAAYEFALNTGSDAWVEQRRIDGSDTTEGDVFGHAVGIAGTDLWIGAPVNRGIENGITSVYTDDLAMRVRYTEEETNTEDSFGHRIAASDEIVAVTASGLDHQHGGVFVFERDTNGAWARTDILLSPPDMLGAVFGEEHRCDEDGMAEGFECDDVELLAYIPSSLLTAPEDARGVRANDNWGWTDAETGREYALVGRNDGTSFIDITDPTNPILVGNLPKTPNTPRSQLWRDIKTYENHAYIVADGAGAHGMQVFDLTRLRDVVDAPVMFEPDLLYRGDGLNVVESTHNVIINEETGYAYLTSRGCAGMHMIDIREPMNPTFAGCTEPGSTHDAQCVIYRGPDESYQGREVCLRMAGDLFQISDVTDKSNPVELSTASHPNPAYMHQGWVTEDHRYFIMNDESDVIAGNVDRTRTLIWDLDDLEDPVLAQEFFGSMPASAHNLYVKGDFTYQANYKYGLHILDTSDPLNPVEVGKFDTSPYGTGPGFGGAWSTYPFFDSGTILVTSMQEGLFMVKKRTRPISQ